MTRSTDIRLTWRLALAFYWYMRAYGKHGAWAVLGAGQALTAGATRALTGHLPVSWQGEMHPVVEQRLVEAAEAFVKDGLWWSLWKARDPNAKGSQLLLDYLPPVLAATSLQIKRLKTEP